MGVLWQALIVALLGGSVGFAELVGRYRSDPKALGRSLAAWLYIGVNALAGVVALLLIRGFDWKFGQTENVDLFRILVAGFGAIAFFRSSLFVTRIGGANVGVGPSLVLGALLDAFDREVDRKSAEEISNVMRADKLAGLDPAAVMFALPVLCLALMQNLAPGDQAQLGAELINIRKDKNLSPQVKMRFVTVQLAKYLGADLVEQVLTNAREIFVEPPAAPAASVIEQAKQELVVQAQESAAEAGGEADD